MGHHITTSGWSRPRRRRLTQLPKHRGRPTFGQTLVAWNEPHLQNTRFIEPQGHRSGPVDRHHTPSAREYIQCQEVSYGARDDVEDGGGMRLRF